MQFQDTNDLRKIADIIKNCVVIIQDSSGANVLNVRFTPRLGNSCYYYDFDSIAYQLFIYEQYK
ncbi:MAG: hypothetical protein ACE1S7_08550 [Candidatus Tisiphia sp.]